MSLQTWISLRSLLAVGLALYAALRGFRTELKADIGDLREELRTTRSDVKADVNRLDERIYLLATGLQPQLAASHAGSTGQAPPAPAVSR